MNDIEVGLTLRRLRENVGMSQTEFAFVTGFRLQTTISRLENGERVLSLGEAMKIADAFGLSVDSLFRPDKREPVSGLLIARIESLVIHAQGLAILAKAVSA